jgi:hypothetical protein
MPATSRRRRESCLPAGEQQAASAVERHPGRGRAARRSRHSPPPRARRSSEVARPAGTCRRRPTAQASATCGRTARGGRRGRARRRRGCHGPRDGEEREHHVERTAPRLHRRLPQRAVVAPSPQAGPRPGGQRRAGRRPCPVTGASAQSSTYTTSSGRRASARLQRHAAQMPPSTCRWPSGRRTGGKSPAASRTRRAGPRAGPRSACTAVPQSRQVVVTVQRTPARSGRARHLRRDQPRSGRSRRAARPRGSHRAHHARALRPAPGAAPAGAGVAPPARQVTGARHDGSAARNAALSAPALQPNSASGSTPASAAQQPARPGRRRARRRPPEDEQVAGDGHRPACLLPRRRAARIRDCSCAARPPAVRPTVAVEGPFCSSAGSVLAAPVEEGT